MGEVHELYLDEEWKALIKEALELGITPTEIQDFLQEKLTVLEPTDEI